MYQEKPEKTMTDKMLDFLSRVLPDEEEIIRQEDLRAVSERLKKASL